MIQIVWCRCIQSKLRQYGVSFYKEQKFYDYIDDVYLVTCPRHPQFKGRFMNTNVEMTCYCLSLQKGRCNNCKTFCFTLNCLADTIKLGTISDVPDDVKLVKINDCLEKDVKSMLSFYLCFKCMKVH